MEQDKERGFYKALGAVPEVPGGVLEKVERRVRSSGVKRRAALAACLLLAFIIPAIVLKTVKPSAAYADDHDAMDELFYAFEFLGGFSSDDGYMMLDAILDEDTAVAVRPTAPEPPSSKQLTKKSIDQKEPKNEKK